MSPDRQDVTRLLQQWRGGDHEALDQLMPIVYDELRRLVGEMPAIGTTRSHLAGDSPGSRGLHPADGRGHRMAGPGPLLRGGGPSGSPHPCGIRPDALVAKNVAAGREPSPIG